MLVPSSHKTVRTGSANVSVSESFPTAVPALSMESRLGTNETLRNTLFLFELLPLVLSASVSTRNPVVPID